MHNAIPPVFAMIRALFFVLLSLLLAVPAQADQVTERPVLRLVFMAGSAGAVLPCPS